MTVAAPIYLPEDEFTLPPLLYDIESTAGIREEGFNVTDLHKKKRRTQKGEWLRYGDTLDLPARLAIEVIERETLKWLGGGVFQGKIGLHASVKDDLLYEVSLNRGWMRVWVKEGKESPKIQIHTAHGIFEATNAEFWISSRPAQTEIYLIRGEVTRVQNKLPLVNRSYAVFEAGQELPRYVAKAWDMNAVEVRLSSSYPSLGRLVARAVRDWDMDKVAKIYGDYRKKGWRKADPLDPKSKILK